MGVSLLVCKECKCNLLDIWMKPAEQKVSRILAWVMHKPDCSHEAILLQQDDVLTEQLHHASSRHHQCWCMLCLMKVVAAYTHTQSACCCHVAESYSRLSDASVVVLCWRSCCRRPVSSLPSDFKPGSYGLHSKHTHDTPLLLIHHDGLHPDPTRSD